MANKDLRTWNCRHCGRSNVTSVSLEGTVECQFCSQLTSIQPSRVPPKPPASAPAKRRTASTSAV